LYVRKPPVAHPLAGKPAGVEAPALFVVTTENGVTAKLISLVAIN
jgi:hypothetical protein